MSTYLATHSFLLLGVLLALSLIADKIFKIKSDKFYASFHFAGGFLITLFWFGFFKNYFLSLTFTAAVGILWEIGEWLQWKRGKRTKWERFDTISDLILDFIGGIIAIIFIHYLL